MSGACPQRLVDPACGIPVDVATRPEIRAALDEERAAAGGAGAMAEEAGA